MPRRSPLSAADHESLLALPETREDLIRYYTLSEGDLSLIRQQRGLANRGQTQNSEVKARQGQRAVGICDGEQRRAFAKAIVFCRSGQMPRRSPLSSVDRDSLLALPETSDELIRHYTFNEAELSIIRQHRGDDTMIPKRAVDLRLFNAARSHTASRQFVKKCQFIEVFFQQLSISGSEFSFWCG